MINNLKKFFTNGHERTLKARKNVIISFLFKGLSIIINLALVPLTLDYLNPTRYGIWLTISSIVGWLSFFDIGLGNGLRNRFAEAKAHKNDELARNYVSTTYAILSIISITVFFVFNFIYPFINWSQLLNVPIEYSSEIASVIYTVFSFYCLQLVLNLIGTILTADQKPAMNNFFNFLYTFISFITIFILTKSTNGSLFNLSLALSSIPVAVLIIFSVYFYKFDYYNIRPKFKYIKLSLTKDITTLGFSFFIIQLSYIIIFSTSNVLISVFFSPADVTPYNISYKYFSIVTMGYSIFMTPYWTGFTDAYQKKDKNWIENTLKNLKKYFFLIILLVSIMFFISPFVYKIWIGDSIFFDVRISFLIAIYLLLYIYIQPYAYFLNGISKIKTQLIISIITSLVNIPLAFLLIKIFHLKIYGVILSPIISLIPFAILLPIETKNAIKKI